MDLYTSWTSVTEASWEVQEFLNSREAHSQSISDYCDVGGDAHNNYGCLSACVMFHQPLVMLRWARILVLFLKSLMITAARNIMLGT